MTRASQLPAEPAARNERARINNVFLDDVLAGLAQPRKSIPSKYFYDRRGSQLFEAICELDEYYPTRTEIGILHACAQELRDLVPAGAAIIEFGSGSAAKIRVLLRGLRAPRRYMPIDISDEHLLATAQSVAADYPELTVVPLHHDFTLPIEPEAIPQFMPRLGFFPGSTIGNFTPPEALAFLQAAATTLGPGGLFLIGVDLKKDRAILEAAYNDADGVTAAFNLNVLSRINDELDADFDLGAFWHHAVYNSAEGRIEMHLISAKEQTVAIDGHRFDFAAGESIHTENSYKHSVSDFNGLAEQAGFATVRTWIDPDRLFSVHLCVADKKPI